MNLPDISLPSHPEWVALYEKAIAISQGNIQTTPFPNWETHIACMPGVPICWVWDSCFIALYSRYFNGQLPALGNIDNLYRQQAEDGLITMAYRMDRNEPAYGTRINPPLFAWTESDWVRQTGDLSRIPRILPHLVRLFDWMQANRRKADGLYWYEDTGSSGMDNAPRSGYPAAALNGSDICYVDLIAQQAHAAECIAWLAMQINDSHTAARFRREREALLPLIERHWSPRTRFYYDLFFLEDRESSHNYVNHRTVAGFWPMLAGACRPEQVEALVKALFDPDDFYTPHPIATLSRQDPNYDPQGGYWLGGVWAPTNYMIVRGLRRYGYYEQARAIATRHLAAMHRVAAHPEYGSIWECYCPEHDAPATNSKGKRCRPNFVGWSGLGPISMLFEDVLGLECDATSNTIHWRPGEAFALERFPFNGGTLSMRYDGGSSLEVATTHAITLEVISKTNRESHALVQGSQHLQIMKIFDRVEPQS